MDRPAVQAAAAEASKFQVVRRIGDLSVLPTLPFMNAVAWLQGPLRRQRVIDVCVA